MKNLLKKAAIDYAKQGLKVFPLEEKGKKPMEKGWQESATSDVGKVKKFWQKYPQANVGILTGKQNDLVVIDVDVKNGKDGFKTLGKFLAKELKSSDACKVKTPSGGMHFYFKYTDTLPNNKTGIVDGIDVRSNGGYIVSPPSKLEGGKYKWI